MSFKLTILGSSSALPTSERFPSAHVLNVHERPFLIDCGEGTQIQLRRNRIRMGKINHIFISHLHGDHIFGIYGILSSLNLMGRKHPLAIYAPEGYDLILRSHLNDLSIYLDYDIVAVPLAGNESFKILDDKHITVTAFPLKHRIPTYGFLFREKRKERRIIKEAIGKYSVPVSQMKSIKTGADLITGEGVVIPNELLTESPREPLSYAYCSDTMWFDRLPSFVRDADLLYHEATYDKSNSRLAKNTGHSTTIDAARVALEAGAGRLVIGHFSSRYKDVAPLVEEARTIFSDTVAAEEGMIIDVTKIRIT